MWGRKSGRSLSPPFALSFLCRRRDNGQGSPLGSNSGGISRVAGQNRRQYGHPVLEGGKPLHEASQNTTEGADLSGEAQTSIPINRRLLQGRGIRLNPRRPSCKWDLDHHGLGKGVGLDGATDRELI
ncbi:radical sam spasm domain family [Lasius niger]|uniref:Radical sam spasm domain family n=1 Tax=Lasius niger TaxID=67767 RepID=A0A0J7KRH3_LASNI|nr:radical sam spasm domain family [Lasius niger]